MDGEYEYLEMETNLILYTVAELCNFKMCL
jgi:hypothetical protein